MNKTGLNLHNVRLHLPKINNRNKLPWLVFAIIAVLVSVALSSCSSSGKPRTVAGGACGEVVYAAESGLNTIVGQIFDFRVAVDATRECEEPGAEDG